MPLYNFTLDDTSALFRYTNPDGKPWTDSPTSDPPLSSYWSSTYHSSSQFGASATLKFQGVAVYIYDAKRWQHGQFTIYLDGQNVLTGNHSAPTSSFKELMYSAENLSPGWHNLTTVNTDPSNNRYTEVDFVAWTTTMNSSLYEVYATDIPHTPGNMTYSSLTAWTEEQDAQPTMVTSTYGASVKIDFEGNGIILNGKTGASFGEFTAQVDSYDTHELTAVSAQTHSSVLFRQDGLPDGKHTLVVTNKGYSSLSIGSATPVVWSTTTNLPTPGSSASTQEPSSHTGAIAGGIVGGVVILALFTLFLLWALRRRRRQQDRQNSADVDGVIDDRAAPAFVHTTPFVLPPTPAATQSIQYTQSSHRDSKVGLSSTGFDGSMYHAVPGSPGMSSRGSFDGPGTVGQGSSSGGGPSVAGWASTARGREQRHSGLGIRNDFIGNDEDPLRDRDAGPVLLPQLPPAYSAPPQSVPGESSGPAALAPETATVSSKDPNRLTPVSRA
ncbi:hypothetical protein BDV93DRAFT_526285 [Ceratobasidium sp. AG-I]|nr:hypothetical protein BDV93DRAFT_526285 [Ceratobasidium sp. AG-I]